MHRASINHLSSSYAPSTHTFFWGGGGGSLLLAGLILIIIASSFPFSLLMAAFTDVILCLCLNNNFFDMFLHYPWKHRVTAFELSHYLKWNLAFGKNSVSVFLRPVNTVNSCSILLSQESWVQECSVLNLFYMQPVWKLITWMKLYYQDQLYK